MNYCVPNLKFDWLAVNRNHSSTEFNSDSEIMHRLKPLISKLQEQTRFPHTYEHNSRFKTQIELGL